MGGLWGAISYTASDFHDVFSLRINFNMRSYRTVNYTYLLKSESATAPLNVRLNFGEEWRAAESELQTISDICDAVDARVNFNIVIYYAVY